MALTLKKRRALLSVCAGVFIIAAPVMIFYLTGYRLTSDFKIKKTGGIYVYSPQSGSKIFINNLYKESTGIIQSGIFIQNLTPGKYSIIVARDGFWPWQKTIDVKEELVSELRAILVPKDPEGKIILKGLFTDLYVSPYEKIIALTEKNSKNENYKLNFYLPEQNIFLNPDSDYSAELLTFEEIQRFKWEGNGIVILTDPKNEIIKISFDLDKQTFTAEKILNNKDFSFVPDEFKSSNFNLEKLKPLLESNMVKIIGRKKEIVWKDSKNNIWFDIDPQETQLPYFVYGEKNIKMPLKILNSKFPILNIDFFPERRDAIIAAINNGVFAIELDGRGGRIIQPIYKGKNPNFGIFKGEKTVYVLDEGNLSEIKLQ